MIGHRGDRRLHVKASDVDRGLSMQALTAALGPYRAARAGGRQQPRTQLRQAGARTGPLYEAFKQERDAALAAREAALKALRQQHLAYAQRPQGVLPRALPAGTADRVARRS